MLEPLLQLFCDTINNTDESLYDSGWGEAASPSDEAPGFAYVDDTANCDIGAIRYLAFPVEGTRPKQNTLDGENWLSQILNITSNHRIRVTPDPAIERVRRKLEARFLALQERIVVNDYTYSPSEHDFAEIVVYDPWSRPMS